MKVKKTYESEDNLWKWRNLLRWRKLMNVKKSNEGRENFWRLRILWKFKKAMNQFFKSYYYLCYFSNTHLCPTFWTCFMTYNLFVCDQISSLKTNIQLKHICFRITYKINLQPWWQPLFPEARWPSPGSPFQA